MKTETVRKTVTAAMFAALACVATMVIKIPIPATNGYINIGDCIVIMSGWLLGGVYGTAAAGIGSMLADLLLGYAAFAPGTLVVKALTALTAFAVNKVLSGKSGGFAAYLVSSFLAEAVMVLGYFAYESTILGYGIGAAASIPANMIQGAGGIVISTALIQILKNNKYIRRIQNM